MGKIIIITFAFMAFAFYEMSGGSEFVPIADEKRAALEVERAEEERLLAEAKIERLNAAPTPLPEVILASAIVTREVTEPTPSVVDETVAVPLEDEKVEELVAAVAEADEPLRDIREVTAARVNMRSGPGQNFGIIAKLSNGEEVEILQDPGNGWVKLRVRENGNEGWMADFLLTASNN